MMENIVRGQNESFLTRLLLKFSPGLAREKQKVDSMCHKSDIIIKQYSELSKEIRDEVDRNHFSTLLNYEKRA
jgi:hypothetical protein